MPLFSVSRTQMLTIVVEVDAANQREAANTFWRMTNHPADAVDNLGVVGFDVELGQTVFNGDGFITVEAGTFLIRANDQIGPVRIPRKKRKRQTIQE